MVEKELRIGVFVCDCGLNIAGTVDMAAVAEFSETLDRVVVAIRNIYTCAEPGQNEIRNTVTVLTEEEEKQNTLSQRHKAPRLMMGVLP